MVRAMAMAERAVRVKETILYDLGVEVTEAFRGWCGKVSVCVSGDGCCSGVCCRTWWGKERVYRGISRDLYRQRRSRLLLCVCLMGCFVGGVSRLDPMFGRCILTEVLVVVMRDEESLIPGLWCL